jgi:hypothetical protein
MGAGAAFPGYPYYSRDDGYLCTDDTCDSNTGECAFTPNGCSSTTTTTTVATTTTTIPPDADGDGVPDGAEACFCTETAAGDPVTVFGCAVSQLCPCNAPVGRSAWTSHGEYVRCAKGAARELEAAGVITRDQRRSRGRRQGARAGGNNARRRLPGEPPHIEP